MNLKECVKAVQWIYDYASMLENKDTLSTTYINTKLDSLEKELSAYRKQKEKLEAVIESDKNIIKDYERSIAREKEDNKKMRSELEKYKALYEDLLIKSKKQESDDREQRRMTSPDGEYRVTNKDNRVTRYNKVFEKDYNGIKVVKWVRMDDN